MHRGIYPIYKPVGISSQQAVQIVKGQFPEGEKVGHAGTLDPMAEGVLVVAIGRLFTKKLSDVVAKEKEYIATITLGATSTTDDKEGDITVHDHAKAPSVGKILRLPKDFTGTFEQIPPAYSAIKVNGKEAYKRVRKGEDLEMEPREVTIKDFEELEYEYPTLVIRVVTGPGVYIRALARDIGQELGVGGYLSSLVRTRVGKFTEQIALDLDNIERQANDFYKEHKDLCQGLDM
jgi:tRNA pseudouridine55 synthase